MEVVVTALTESMSIIVIQDTVHSVALLHMEVVHTVHLENICMAAMVENVNTVVQHQLVHVPIAHMESMKDSNINI